MRAGDLAPVEALTAHAFDGGPDAAAARRPPERTEAWLRRASHVLGTDPGGCWVADDEATGEVVGVAMATRRDLLWTLFTYAVRPGRQGAGIGAALLDAALAYGAGCLRGMICALPDPKALRRYRRAGFALHPTMRLEGVVDRSALPAVDGVRVGSDGDRDLADSVDRRLRGAAHGPDHEALAAQATLLVCDLFTGSGYVYVTDSDIGLLAATSKAIAQRLLWSALAHLPAATTVAARYLTADQDWAVDVGLAAGLQIGRDGFLALRQMRPPAPYVPSVHFG